ncbi:hypothetical protein J7L05_09215 [bacterium]|nr:hypothetical protein [bacterium]
MSIKYYEHNHEQAKPSAHNPKRTFLWSPVIRFLGIWGGFTGLYLGSGGVCPFCGQPSCPVGIGAAAAGGGFLSFVVHYISRKIHPNRKTDDNKTSEPPE